MCGGAAQWEVPQVSQEDNVLATRGGMPESVYGGGGSGGDDPT